MSKQTEALKLALEALEFNCVMSEDGEDLTPRKIKKAITALREALAEQRKPLTDEEIKELYGDDDNFRMTKKYVVAFARAIEVAHGIKEKNT